MKVNVSRARFEAKQENMKEQRMQMITFAIALGCTICRDKWNFGKRRLDRLVRGAYEEITEWYEHYGGNPPEEGMNPDNVPTLYHGMRIQADALGIPLDEIEREYALSPDFSGWRSLNDRKVRKYRFEELESMRMITRAYWYAMLLHLWHTYGNGGEVLTWVYRRIQEEWARVMRLYLECDNRKDGMVDKAMRGEIRAIEKIGVKL